MLIEEYPYAGRENLIRHYSDAGMMIHQFEFDRFGKRIDTGNEYGEAIDRYPCRYTYEETDTPIEPEETEMV